MLATLAIVVTIVILATRSTRARRVLRVRWRGLWYSSLARLAMLSGWRAHAAAAALGLLSALALPPLYVLPALLVAVPGLLALIDGARTWRGALLRGFWFGFAHHLIGLYWVTAAILVEAARYWWLVPLAVPALSVVMALFIAAAGRRRATRPRGLAEGSALAGAWTLLDLLRQFIATGFPWNPLGRRLDDAGHARKHLRPACRLDRHARTDAADRPAGDDAGAGPSGDDDRRRRPGRLGRVRRVASVGTARRRRPASRSCWCRATWPRARNGIGRGRSASSRTIWC